jgi:hypothetical protein
VRDGLHVAKKQGSGGTLTGLALSAIALASTGAAILGRRGTHSTRVAAFVLVGSALVAAVTLAVVEWRKWSDARRAIRRVVGESDAPLAGAIDRAAQLLERSESDAAHATSGESGETDGARDAVQLSELHLSRQLRKISFDRIAERAARRGQLLAGIAVAFALGALGLVGLEPMRVVEGVDVLATRGPEAPFALVYVDDVDILSSPPPYLQAPDREISDFGSTKAPRGSTISVRGKPLRPGRALVLTDGTHEEPFVPDGSGNVVAKWTVTDDAALRIGARFGSVLIPQRDQLAVTSIPDEAPVVKLEGAPTTVKLIDTPSVALKYEASDDHGLREIALVLRSGTEIDRRVLSRLSSDTKTARGGEELSTREPFFRSSFLPVEVTIEARDNDAVMGPKWGRSAAIVVVPPDVGEPEARRYAALLRIRDAFVDLAAPRVTKDLAREKDLPALARAEVDAQRTTDVAVDDILAGTYGGRPIRGRVRSIIAGQMRVLDHEVATFEDGPSAKGYASLVSKTEDAVLAVDAAVRAQGFRDSAKVAKKLSVVAASVAELAHGFDRDPDRASAGVRIDAAIGVLDGGGKQLLALGDLGLDLGDVVRGGVGRIRRPRSHGDMVHAEIAARDLAERLKHADASLGGGGRAGVESGGPPSGGGGADEGEASDAESEAEASAKELEELIQHHAQQIGKVADAMRKATTPEEREALKKLAKEQADAIREAVKGLPQQGAPGTPAAKAAEGRKHAEAMAGALEQGDTDEALKRGDEALRSLRDAAEQGKASPFADDRELGNDSTRAGNRVDEALESLRDMLDQMKQESQERAKDDLENAGKDEERLSERARDLAKRGEKDSSAMPEDTLEKLDEAREAMKDAAKALEEGDAERGKSLQEEAQRLLEMAKGEDSDEEESESRSDSPDAANGKRMSQNTKVPPKGNPKAPEDFQKRVTDGLGMPQDARLKDAIKRYAEGLLR